MNCKKAFDPQIRWLLKFGDTDLDDVSDDYDISLRSIVRTHVHPDFGSLGSEVWLMSSKKKSCHVIQVF